MRDSRFLVATALVVALATLADVTAFAADDTPEQVLAGRGLERSGMLYILAAESDFVPKVAKLQPQYRALQTKFDKLALVLQNQAEYDVLDNQWTLVSEQLGNVQAEIDAHPPLSNNVLRQNWQNLLDTEKQLRFQYNELKREVNIRYRKLVPESERDELRREFLKEREEFLESSRELRAQADTIKGQYTALAKDAVVKKALAALKTTTKASLTVAPTGDFKKASTWLTNAVRNTAPESLKPKNVRKPARTQSKSARKQQG